VPYSQPSPDCRPASAKSADRLPTHPPRLAPAPDPAEMDAAHSPGPSAPVRAATRADRPDRLREPPVGFRRMHGEPRRLGHKVSPTTVRRAPRAAGLGRAPRRHPASGPPSSRPTRTGCSPPTCSTWTPSASSGCTPCSSWRCAPAPSTSSASPPIRPRGLDHATGPATAVAPRRSRRRVHPPGLGPGREVHRRPRRRPRRRGHHRGQDPPRGPNRNPHAERFIRSVREECTDRVPLLDRGHAERVPRDYARHLSRHRPHQGRDRAMLKTCGSILGGTRKAYLPE
jgi:hypothetical protein